MHGSLQTDRQTDRQYYIDLVESIAIFFVLSYHGTNYDYNFLQDSESVLFYIRYFVRTILSCCVPLFFFANGYLLFNRDFYLKKHIEKMIRLTLLTIIWGIIDLFVLMFIKNEFLSLKDFVKGVWGWKQGWINHLWYMQALIVIYALFPLLKIAFDKRKDIFAFFIVIAAIMTFGNKAINSIASIAAHLVLSKNTEYSINWFNGFNPFRGLYGYAFVYFCAGGVANDIYNKLCFLRKPYNNVIIIFLSMLGLFATGIILSHVCNNIWDVVWNGYDTVFTFINVICIFALCKEYNGRKSWFRKIIYTISVNTLGIYFIHVLFNQLIRPYVREIAFLSNIPGNIIFAHIILFISLFAVIIIKKIPVLKRLVM